MNYVEVHIALQDKALHDILIAELSDIDYEGFEEDGNNLKAFIPVDSFSETQLKEVKDTYQVAYTTRVVEDQNWNAEWEKDFQPVTVGDFCTIRATFHPADTTVKHEIIITPKMSFGTGHHATTQMMIQQMSQLDFTGKKVLDFGTGTGVLAILAEKLNAASIFAVDTDEWSYENTLENIDRNNALKIDVRLGSLEAVNDSGYDIILANINRHILLQYMQDMKTLLAPGGCVLMSGILDQDKSLIAAEAAKAGFVMGEVLNQDKWICIRFYI